jgi:hypothetical protein
MIYKYCNPGNDFAIFRVGVLEHGPTPNIEVHIWHPAVVSWLPLKSLAQYNIFCTFISASQAHSTVSNVNFD